MAERKESWWRGRPLSSYSTAWLGAGWTGVAAHAAAAAGMTLRSRNDLFPLWSYVHLGDYLALVIFLSCVAGYYCRLRRPFLAIWLIFALIWVLAMFSGRWGDALLEANEALKRQFLGFSFLADGLFAYGSVILLVTSIALIWGEWRERGAGRSAARPPSGYLTGWLGAAWAGVAAHFFAGACGALMFSGSVLVLTQFRPADYVVAAIFLACVAGHRTRLRRPLLALWSIGALLGTLWVFSGPWGNPSFGVDVPQMRQFYGFSFLTDGLFAFGSLVLLLAGLALTWKEWRERRAG